ncbi:MAG: FAD binding domain-containing protein [bacterium]|nr:FAD binding domain-containing protein [Acidimicrobiia bacterium]MCY4649997.1 FAD binding domain-containing protein [bacterium]
MDIDVRIPDSSRAAAADFGDGSGVSVMAGGTIMMNLLNSYRAQPSKVLLLHKAGLSYVNQDGSTVTIGATTPLADLAGLPAPLGPCAANIGDPAIRGQGTVGGNLCAIASEEFPVGDLQGALLALGATVRSTGEGGERTEGLAEFLSSGGSRLLLEVSFQLPAAGAFEALRRPHTKHFTPLAVSGALASDGEVRLAATGAASTGVRLSSAEAAANDPSEAGQAALEDVTLADDALASAWYRGRTLPTLVERVLTQLKEQA